MGIKGRQLQHKHINTLQTAIANDAMHDFTSTHTFFTACHIFMNIKFLFIEFL